MLGVVQALVGVRDQSLVVGKAGALGQADAGGDLQARREIAAVDRFDRRTQFLGLPRGLGRVGAREQQRELLAAPARHALVAGPVFNRPASHLLLHGLGHAPQRLVADVVRVAVVDALEMVDVEQAEA